MFLKHTNKHRYTQNFLDIFFKKKLYMDEVELLC